VMCWLRQKDYIIFARVGLTTGEYDQVDTLGGSAGKNDRLRLRVKVVSKQLA
jgi:hypothetical protein